MKQIWIPVNKGEKPKINDNQEVIGYNKKWIDPDYNPNGTRACFTTDNATYGWQSAKFCTCNDGFINDMRSAPTHYMLIPKFAITDCEFVYCSLNENGTCCSTIEQKCKSIPDGMEDYSLKK